MRAEVEICPRMPASKILDDIRYLRKSRKVARTVEVLRMHTLLRLVVPAYKPLNRSVMSSYPNLCSCRTTFHSLLSFLRKAEDLKGIHHQQIPEFIYNLLRCMHSASLRTIYDLRSTPQVLQ